jgi:hypothetical protein
MGGGSYWCTTLYMFLLLFCLTLISMDTSLAIDVGLLHLTLLQKTGLLSLVVANKTYLKW